jgi:hypothetical protein
MLVKQCRKPALNGWFIPSFMVYVYMYGIEFNLGMMFTLVKTQHEATTVAAAKTYLL